MKETMSNVDIRVILPEINHIAKGAFIKNIYQYGSNFVLKLYQPGGGTHQLLVEPGQRIHLTEYRRRAPRIPSAFVTVLRKYLRNKKVMKVEQHELDRIVVIEVEDETGTLKVVAELFGIGNLLLLDSEDRIFVAQRYKKMRDRNVVPKALYKFPPPRGIDVFNMDMNKLVETIADSKSNIVRALVSRLNLDALSCEEICALADIPPTTRISDLDTQAVGRLQTSVEEFRIKLSQGVNKPRIVFNENSEKQEKIAFVPFAFKMFQDKPFQVFETYSRTIDEYFGVVGEETGTEQQRERLSKEQQRLLRIIEKQQESIEMLEKKAENARRIGELIYANFQTVQDVLQTITQARANGLSWDDITNRIEEGKRNGNPVAAIIKRIIPSEAQVIVILNGFDVVLDIRRSVQENAAYAYELAKKSEAKIEGAKKQIEKTKTKLEALEEVVVEEHPHRPVRIRKKKWYEKFRWFVSSGGYLVLGGRDTKSNEQLVKRYMGPNDVFLHAALHGAPYTIIKVPNEAPDEQTIQEAAQFAITFSRAWQDGLVSGDAYWVRPEQVSFTPPSGEYLPTGAVMIYGSKNYVRSVPIELAVGVLIENDQAIPISGPPTAISAHTEYFVRVVPGNIKKGQLVKEVLRKIKQKIPEQYVFFVDEIPNEDMMRVLPPGSGKIVDE